MPAKIFQTEIKQIEKNDENVDIGRGGYKLKQSVVELLIQIASSIYVNLMCCNLINFSVVHFLRKHFSKLIECLDKIVLIDNQANALI